MSVIEWIQDPGFRRGVGGQRHAPAALPPVKWPSTHCTVGSVGLGAGLHGSKKSRPNRDLIPGPSSP